MSYLMLGVRVQMNPTPAGFNPNVGRDTKITHIGRRPSGRPRGLQSHPSALRVRKHRSPAPEVRPHRGPSCGAGFGPYSLLRHGFGDHPQLSGSEVSRMALSGMGAGASTCWRDSSISMFSSTSSSTTTSESPC